MMFTIGGNSKGIMTALSTEAVYPIGTVISMRIYGHDHKRYVVVGDTMGTYGEGQRAIAEDLTSETDVNQTSEAKHGGIGIGSFDVVDDLIYTQAQVEFLKNAYADKQRQEREAKNKREREAAEAKQLAIQAGTPIYEASKPSGAVAVIVARLKEDTSDYYSDYQDSKTTKTVVLAFSKHTRDLFDEMRSAALHFDETKFFATDEDCKQYEHREKWSMGHGYYLAKSRYSGWQIQKQTIGDSADWLCVLAANPDTWKVPANGIQDSGEASDISSGDVTVKENKEKQGIEIYFANKPAADVIAKIKANGWRWAKYNKCWYKKASPVALEFAKQFVNQKA